MTIDQSIDVVKNLMMLCLKVALPFLLSAMIIGCLLVFSRLLHHYKNRRLLLCRKRLGLLLLSSFCFHG